MAKTDDTFLGHVEALRTALLRMFAGTAAAFPAAWLASGPAIRALARFCLPPEAGPLHFFAPMEAFWTQMRLALVLSLALAFPWNAWQAWLFLAPGLHCGERRAVKVWTAVSTALFAAGAAFCVFAILPLVMRFGAGFASEGLRPVFGLAGFVGLSGWLALAFGIMFQAPVVALAAVRLGVVRRETLAKARPFVVVAILALAAVLTPPDVVSQVLLALPTWLLFELGLFLSKPPTKDRR